MREKIITKLIRNGCFLSVLSIFYGAISHVFLMTVDTNNNSINYQQVVGFCEETDALDVVYIGASPTYTSFIAPLVWEKYGITSRTFGNTTQPFAVVDSFLKLAHEKQKDAIFLVAINGVYRVDYLTMEEIHHSVDFYPMGIEKLKLIHTLSDSFGLSLEDRAELLFPIIRYHYAWSNGFSSTSFIRDLVYKGACSDTSFLTETEDVSSYRIETNVIETPPEYMQKGLTSLLAYCKEQELKVIFVFSAQYKVEYEMNWINWEKKIIEEAGFPIIDELKEFDNIGLDSKTDFYNARHTNVHGALKITEYLSKYLLDHYYFEDKRRNEAYADWDEAYDNYKQIITPYLTEKELMQLP